MVVPLRGLGGGRSVPSVGWTRWHRSIQLVCVYDVYLLLCTLDTLEVECRLAAVVVAAVLNGSYPHSFLANCTTSYQNSLYLLVLVLHCTSTYYNTSSRWRQNRSNDCGTPRASYQSLRLLVVERDPLRILRSTLEGARGRRSTLRGRTKERLASLGDLVRW